MDIVCKVALLTITIAFVSCEQCEPVTIESCFNAGYTLTARFPDVDGRPYQDVHKYRLKTYIPLLETCSSFTSTILCSLYVPKCEEGRAKPWIPCRKVCSKFVAECVGTLRVAGLLGLFTTLCDLLPDENPQSAKNCFYPSNFNGPTSGGPVTNVCHNVTVQTCSGHLHYGKTFIPPRLQTGLEETIFSTVINSKCSTELEKFLCYTQFPPCYPNRPAMTSVPCKSLCDVVDKKCWKEFNALGIPLTDCNFIYPRENTATGLCNLTQWPAAWPKEFRPSPYPLGSCEEITVKSCANAGYKFTARFGKQFQDYKGQLLDTLLPLLQSCSQHSSLILCSLYLPKCIEGVGRPMLPCRQVCLDFAEKCKSQLQYASTHGMTVALCDLLPVYDGTSDKCIMPPNFQSSNLFSSRNVCHKMTSNKCSNDLHYSKTFVPSDDQNPIVLTGLQRVIDSNCSPDVEKYLCYISLPPCTLNSSVVHLPCRELCKRVNRDCADALRTNSIPALHCDYLFPPGDGDRDGLCDLKKWPAPWPWKIPDPVPPTSAGPAKCVPLKANVCEGAGYDFTANFPPIDGKSYQEVKSRSLQFFLDFLKICSPYSKAVMCSFSMPKCVEGVERPIPPCRSVCLEFVGSCQMLLSLASHAGLFRALCDLLPEQDSWPNTCFVPDGFKRTLPAVAKRGGTCSKVVKPQYCIADLHYNQTFVPERNQSSYSVLQGILNSKCSSEFEKYLCYTSVPPCKPNDLSVYVPCRDICEQVKRDCAGEFEKAGILIPDCSWIYPDESHPTGLCKVDKFPAPWPAKRVAEEAAGTKEPQKSSTRGGLIAGIVILLFVIIASVGIGVMYFRWRKGKQQFAAQRFENAPEPKDVQL